MLPRTSFSNTALRHASAAFCLMVFFTAPGVAQSPDTVLPRGTDSTDFGNSSRGKTGPIDWVRDDKTGKLQVMLEKNGHYTDGMFLGRGPDGSDYFTFSAKCYRLSVPKKNTQNHSNPAGVLGGLGRMAGPWGGAAGGAASRIGQTRQSAPQGNFEFTEIPSGEVPPASFLSLGKSPYNAPASGIPVLTEIKNDKGAVVARTLQLPNQNVAMIVNKEPCFGDDAYIVPGNPGAVYMLMRDQNRSITGYRQINNTSGNDPCGATVAAPQTAVSGAPSDPPKPTYTLKEIDGDQYRLIYSQNGRKQDLMVTKLKDKLFCSTSPSKTYMIETDEGLTVLDSDYAMSMKCAMKASQAYQPH